MHVGLSGRGWGRARLDGDSRAGAYARKRSRQLMERYLARGWRPLAIGASGIIVGGVLCSLLMPDPFLRGLLVGATCASAIWIVVSFVTVGSGAAAPAMGELAEQWTAEESRGLRRDGWRLINHLHFESVQIDHVLLGPAGVICVETKWSATPWDSSYGRSVAHQAATRMRAQARTVALLVRLPVTARVVALWGGNSADLAGADGVIATVDGVPLVAGPSLRSWVATLPTGRLTPDQIEDGYQRVSDYIQRHDPLDPTFADVPPGLGTQFQLTAGKLTLGVAAGIVPSTLAVVQPWLPLPVLGGITLVCGVGARLLRDRPAAGWLRVAAVGSAGMLVGVLLLVGLLVWNGR